MCSNCLDFCIHAKLEDDDMDSLRFARKKNDNICHWTVSTFATFNEMLIYIAKIDSRFYHKVSWKLLIARFCQVRDLMGEMSISRNI